MPPLIEKTTQFVEKLLSEKLPGDCLYHNLKHTQRVVKSTKEIVANSSISEEDTTAVILAALLHDIGYINGPENHEEKSVELGQEFLREQQIEEALLRKVSDCILATKFDAEPKTELDKIIRDADASHFAKGYFQEASELLRLEWKMQGKETIGKRKWLKGNIDLLKNEHHFYTEYAKANWNSKKEENIQTMIIEKDILEQKKADKDSKKKKAKKIKNKLKAQDPEKAIQSVFRVTLKNHIKLSDIADTKANILLSVNAIIISIALSNLIPKLDNPSNSYLVIPTAIFVFFTVTAIIMSVLATRPNVTSGKFTKDDVNNKQVNLLFFGNFHKMSLSEFEWAMNELLNDKEYIYSSLTKDLYFLGLVLQRKYAILRLTYTVFMAGIIISVIAFLIAFLSTGV